MVRKCVICVILVAMTASVVQSMGIPDEQDFGPILRPANPTGARNILGYDNFQTSKNAKQQIKYGNHWEQYDTEPIQDFRFNAGGNRYNAQPAQPFFNTPKPHNTINYQRTPVQYR